ncbi:MAG: ATP-binding cassette domain-containing protein [Verrucomicrobia bacterium]|nr:ATP-binding cassette domain-containing protein [Verrucomicrobiota bacterium]MCH8512195.1 ATP-binding cassette domain-containing protein [Kiritimatiellia bacterium]
MALLSVQNLTISYGGPRLLDGVSFTLEKGERVCLVGRNGEGKSTMMRIMSGQETPDAGTLAFRSGAQVAMLPQEVPRDLPGTARDVVESGLGVDTHDPEIMRKVDMLFSQLDVDAYQEFSDLSGGQKRRVLLTRALAAEPDLLLLDEPTNHLDIASIQWMENMLKRFAGAVLFVTHDRAFLRSLATRILELDRGQLSDWDCGYDKYLVRREERLNAEEKQFALQDKKLAQEEAWIRQGIKARRTRNEGRVRALKALREERRARRERTGSVTLAAETSARSGRKVIEVKNLTHKWENEPLIEDFTTTIMRGDKIGLIGPNGCGKTTLLNLLLQKFDPQSGEVIHGTKLDITYYDQHRFQLDEEASIFENVGEGSDMVVIQGKQKHVISYLEDFLFSPERSRTPVKVLSGGERNRLMLAKLFTQTSNVLVMDEPTNDLDMETLELLESLLVEYDGTLLLVSHDREFLNEVVTSTIVFEGEGRLKEYPGGYDDWLDQRPKESKAVAPKAAAASKPAPKAPGIKRLTNWEEKELKELPAKLEAMEAKIERETLRMSTPAFYQLPESEQKAAHQNLGKLTQEMEKTFKRWESLEARAF